MLLFCFLRGSLLQLTDETAAREGSEESESRLQRNYGRTYHFVARCVDIATQKHVADIDWRRARALLSARDLARRCHSVARYLQRYTVVVRHRISADFVNQTSRLDFNCSCIKSFIHFLISLFPVGHSLSRMIISNFTRKNECPVFGFVCFD